MLPHIETHDFHFWICHHYWSHFFIAGLRLSPRSKKDLSIIPSRTRAGAALLRGRIAVELVVAFRGGASSHHLTPPEAGRIQILDVGRTVA